MIVLHGGFEADGLVLWGERPPEAPSRPAGRPGRKPRLEIEVALASSSR